MTTLINIMDWLLPIIRFFIHVLKGFFGTGHFFSDRGLGKGLVIKGRCLTERLPKKLFTAEPGDKYSKGKPRRRREDCVQDDLVDSEFHEDAGRREVSDWWCKSQTFSYIKTFIILDLFF